MGKLFCEEGEYVRPDEFDLLWHESRTSGSLLKNDALVDKGAAAPKPCLSPVERHTTAAGGLLPAGTASTAMRTISPTAFLVLPDRRDEL